MMNKIKTFTLCFFIIMILFVSCDTYEDVKELDATNTPSKTVVKTRVTITPDISKTVIILTATPEATIVTKTPDTAADAQLNSSIIPSKYVYLGQSPADGTVVTPGSQLTVTWSIRNSGIVGWTQDYTIRYFSGVQGKSDSYPFPKIIPVGKVLTVSANFVAPTTPGTYSTWWKLTDEKNQNFGDLDFSFTVAK